MRMLLTGQIGLDKRQYLAEFEALAKARGEAVKVFHVGDMMYREAPDVKPGRILDLPLSRLGSLRRAVFRDILREAPKHKNVIVNSHATFRWKHGLFAAFDFDQLRELQADLYVTLLDNVESIHQRLLLEHGTDHTLKDLMVWREEEILATEILARANAAHPGQFYVLARGRRQPTVDAVFGLLLRPGMRKVYPSFPMSHVMDLPAILAEIDAFRQALRSHFITFDPGDVDEKALHDRAVEIARNGETCITTPAGGTTVRLNVSDILAIGPDIDGQIYARDFMMVRQSDFIVSYIPELPGGKPGLSSGVERELQHAYDHAREAYVIWRPKANPSPFITQTATAVFRDVPTALKHFEEKGYLTPHDLFGGA
ncbi:MAG: AAA family ATPase [Phycisphaerales bacterium]|nr:AAA family ATPase [Phycisphaerales bacterium]